MDSLALISNGYASNYYGGVNTPVEEINIVIDITTPTIQIELIEYDVNIEVTKPDIKIETIDTTIKINSEINIINIEVN